MEIIYVFKRIVEQPAKNTNVQRYFNPTLNLIRFILRPTGRLLGTLKKKQNTKLIKHEKETSE